MNEQNMEPMLNDQQKALFDDLCVMRANAQNAFHRMRDAASANKEFSAEEINAEINEVRAKR
jgi:hypothetical protein